MTVPAPAALSGVRVLDMGRVLSGPFCGMLLADLGAQVIKLEPPGGDLSRRFAPFVDGTRTYYLDGAPDEAEDAVPDQLVDEVALVGPKDHISQQLDAWASCPISTLACYTTDRAASRVMTELLL
jgi:hypothetical protein